MNKKELIILRIYLNKFPICSPISLRGFPVWLSCCCPPDVPADWLLCCCPPCCCPPCCCPPDVPADWLPCCCPPDVPADWLPCCCPPDVPADWLPCCCPPCCCPPCCCPPCCCPPCCCPPCCSLSPAKPLSVEVSLPKSSKRGVVSLLILVGGASGVKACSSSILPISSPAFTCPPLSAPSPPPFCCPPCCCPPCCCPPCCCPPCCCPPDVPAVLFCELPSVWANMGFDKIVETIPIANSRKV